MTPELVAKLEEWRLAQVAAAEVKPVIEREQQLRKEVIALFFPTPKEGTNKAPLLAGWELKCDYKVDRKIEEPAFPAVAAKFKEMGLNVELCIGYDIKLKVKQYKELTEEQKKIFDQCLIIKPGSHTLSLLPPKEA